MLATVSSTAPANPINGQIWFDSSSGVASIYYSSTWVAMGASAPTSTTASVNTAVTIDSFDKTIYRSAEFTIQFTQGSKYATVKALVAHDGTTPQLVQYGIIEIGSPAIALTLSSDISGSDVRLRATITDAATTSAYAKVIKTTIAV